MKRHPSTKPPAKKADDFESVAKRLECDEDQGRFEKTLGKLAKAAPKKK